MRPAALALALAGILPSSLVLAFDGVSCAVEARVIAIEGPSVRIAVLDAAPACASAKGEVFDVEAETSGLENARVGETVPMTRIEIGTPDGAVLLYEMSDDRRA